VVHRKVCSEGSGTAKSGTDGQKRHMRHSVLGKQAHHCNAPCNGTLCRCRGDWRKEPVLTGGGLTSHGMAKGEESAEAIVAPVWYGKEILRQWVAVTNWWLSRHCPTAERQA